MADDTAKNKKAEEDSGGGGAPVKVLTAYIGGGSESLTKAATKNPKIGGLFFSKVEGGEGQNWQNK